ncbi:MAG: carbon starvation protein A [Alistipes sp.]|nr:carbon starvation protein A [Alistipes sp.]
MITFLVCLGLLVAAYFVYGKYLERVCEVKDSAEMPSKVLYDGVDYIPMPLWKTFMIQLLNIAGVGPIFGAIMGACFGPVAFVWITLGGIFIGAMHDYISGIIITRNEGVSLPEVIGRYLGGGIRDIMRVISLILLILVGVVFMRSPASILSMMTPAIPYWWWVAIILVYYFVATMLPIDRLIGKIYPLFGAALLFMALGLAVVLVTGDYTIPELTFATMRNYHPQAESMPIIPTMFITIACGAISGFHATQSPLMARCLNNEREARVSFYGAMISESIITLIWAAVAIGFFAGVEGLSSALAEHGNDAAWAVHTISVTTLGVVGGILAMLGVVAAPITSGDTAYRSARLIIADVLHIEQRSKAKRLAISVPLFAIGSLLLFVDFDVIWRYFAWFNQAMSVITLWVIVAYLKERNRNIWVALPAAMFMTFVCSTFVFTSKQFMGMGATPLSYILGGSLTLLLSALMWRLISKRTNGLKPLK